MIITIVAGIFIVVATIFYKIDPNLYPYFPKCPFLILTGFKCPGCGSQRALHQLLHFNIRESFIYNPLVVILSPYILLGIYLENIGNYKFSNKIKRIMYGKNAASIILFCIITFWITRNIF